MTFRKIAALSDLWRGEIYPFQVDGHKIVVVRLEDGRVCAYADRCAHLGMPLSNGELDEEGVLTCAAHRYQYDAATGQGLNPKSVCLVRYPVAIQDDEVLVETSGVSSR